MTPRASSAASWRPGSRIGSAWRRLSLWPRLVIAVTAGFVLLYAVFGVLAVRAVRESTDRILDERLVMAQMAARTIDGVLEHGFDELERATGFAAFDPGAASLRAEQHLLAHTYARGGTFSLGVYLLDPHGRLVLAEPGRSGPALEPSRGLFSRVVHAPTKRAISAPFRDRASGRAAVALTSPVRNPDGTLRSVLVGVVDVAGIDLARPLDQARELGRTGHAELVNAAGIVIASTERREALHPGEHHAFFLRMLRSSASGVESVPLDWGGAVPAGRLGERHVMAFVPLDAAPWGVALGGSEDETFAPVSRLGRALLLAGALALLVLWGLTLVGARLLVHPVRSLTIASRAMAAGNLATPVRVREGGEVGMLGESLDRMRVQLRASHEELESSVRERTAELATRNRQLAAVAAVATTANQARDLDETLSRCLAVVLDETSMEVGAVRLLDGEALAVPVLRGDSRRLPCGAERVPTDACLCGHAVTTATPLYADGRRIRPCRVAEGHVLAVLPLCAPGETLGVLFLARKGDELPSDEERLTLDAVANQIAAAIQNARLLEELRRADAQREIGRLRAELVSAVSHELRTPLGFITSYATTLLREDAPVDEATRREFLHVIDEETAKLGRMIDELLDVSRLQAGRLSIERTAVAVGDLVAQAVARARTARVQAGHGGPLTVSLPATELVALADPIRTEQVLRNLLQNAACYSEPSDPIEVSVAREGEFAVVSVSDRGDGIAETEQQAIFEPFHRGESSRRRGVAGVGLGLAICRGMVEAQGGTVWVESAVGAGSTFLFTLPLALPVRARWGSAGADPHRAQTPAAAASRPVGGLAVRDAHERPSSRA